MVSHNALNTDYHLTRKNKTWGLWRITDGTTLLQDIERAAVCVTRWHGRPPGSGWAACRSTRKGCPTCG